jgi:hypothetical protein
MGPRAEAAMHSRIGVLRVLNRNVERVFTDRKDLHWGSAS